MYIIFPNNICTLDFEQQNSLSLICEPVTSLVVCKRRTHATYPASRRVGNVTGC
jgi:hypothetical protein